MSSFFSSFQSSRTISREKILLIMTAILILIGLFVASSYVIGKHIWAQGKIAELTPRYQRLEGAWQARDAMQETQIAATELLNVYTYSPELEVSVIGTDVQQKLRSTFSSAGLVLNSSQTLPERTEGSLQIIPVTVRATGSIDDLTSALAQLSSVAPVIRLESINIQQGRKRNQYSPTTLTIQATFIVLRRMA